MVMLSATQIIDLVRQLPPEERRRVLDSLLTERFEAALSTSDVRRADRPALSDEEIQAEVDAVRRQRGEGRRRAPRG